MILAGIDIGTNTLRLLIAETGRESFREIHSDRRITRLGERLDRTGILSPESQNRSIRALADFRKSIDAHAAVGMSAVGTSALRNASNTAEFVAEVSKRTGIIIRVIAGEEEARLTLLGVERTFRGTAGGAAKRFDSALVIDVGGGSTEIIATNAHDGPRETSLPLGAVYLTERYIRHDPPREDELNLLRQSIRTQLDICPCAIRPESVLVGTAGTITTLSAMDQQLTEYDPGKINGSCLSRDSIDRIILKLSRSTLNERRRMAGLEQGREDIILAGAVITQEIMERYGFKKLLVSDWGLREGIVFDLFEKLSKDRE